VAQTFLRFVVDGFLADDYDFSGALQRKLQPFQDDFAAFVAALVDAEVNAASDVFWAVTIVGHSDRFDTPGFTADERRARELYASNERRVSAGAYLLLTAFADGVSAAGLDRPVSAEDPTNLGLSFVSAGAADLVHPAPTSEAERQENRRVKFLAECFSPQPMVLAFGEQLDRDVA